MRKTREDNDMIDQTSMVYIENEIKFSWSIDKVRSMMKNRQDNDETKLTSTLFTKNNIRMSWSIRSSVVYDEN